MLPTIREDASTALPIDDSKRASRDANETSVFVLDADVPHLSPATAMQRCRGRRDFAFGFSAEVIGVELDTYGCLFLAIDVEVCANRRRSLGKRCRRTAMEKPERLTRSIVNGHRRDNFFWREQVQLDADRVCHSAIKELLVRHERNGLLRLRGDLQNLPKDLSHLFSGKIELCCPL